MSQVSFAKKKVTYLVDKFITFISASARRHSLLQTLHIAVVKWWLWSGWCRRSSTTSACFPQYTTSYGTKINHCYTIAQDLKFDDFAFTKKSHSIYFIRLSSQWHRFYLKATRAGERVERTAKYLAVLALLSHDHLCYRPSTVASSLVFLASSAANLFASCYLVTKVISERHIY